MPDSFETKEACLDTVATQPLSMFFTKLPLEIRRLIYSMLLTTKSTINASLIWERFLMDASDRTAERYNPDLGSTVLRVCRQTYNEGFSILYGENDFAFRDLLGMTVFATHGLNDLRRKFISLSNCRKLRHPLIRGFNPQH